MTAQDILDDFISRDIGFQYRILSRLQSDCDYFLGFGSRNPNALYCRSVKDHLFVMRGLHNNFVEKPEWLTVKELDLLESKMLEA
ncbi:LPD11 domain-containing protein [Photobacterium leiognathi]|uniref:LPD11 domain-containing protein n=1 Tax=Photobacterium leiognathi TaxID=553611 RepID=UPI002981891F|nr:LPD11 domain-containing protein [Photobacterium leiognathi]